MGSVFSVLRAMLDQGAGAFGEVRRKGRVRTCLLWREMLLLG